MVITIKLVLQNQKSYDLKTCHVASGTQFLQNLYDPELTLTYFTARSTWVAYRFEWAKLLQSHLMGENLQPPWDGGTKVNIKGACLMAKMVAMPIYGKNL